MISLNLNIFKKKRLFKFFIKIKTFRFRCLIQIYKLFIIHNFINFLIKSHFIQFIVVFILIFYNKVIKISNYTSNSILNLFLILLLLHSFQKFNIIIIFFSNFSQFRKIIQRLLQLKYTIIICSFKLFHNLFKLQFYFISNFCVVFSNYFNCMFNIFYTLIFKFYIIHCF